MGVRQIQLLVALSLLLPPNAPAADDKHKQPSRSIRGKGKRFLAFAYTSERLTSEGKKPIPGTTIAADPRVLPMGSRVRITGAGGYSGIYTVSDKGGAIKGRKVDIFVRSHNEAVQFGRQEVYIDVLDAPQQSTRARRAPDYEPPACQGCGRKQPNVMITRDESVRSNRNLAGRHGAPGRVGTVSGGSDSRKAGDSAAIVSVSSIEGASSN